MDSYPENEYMNEGDWRCVLPDSREPLRYPYDIQYRDAGAPSHQSDKRISIQDVAEFVALYARTNEMGTELKFLCLARLTDDTYAGCFAWNDYTGWGCQDGVTWMFGTYSEVIRWGFDDDERDLLGLIYKQAR